MRARLQGVLLVLIVCGCSSTTPVAVRPSPSSLSSLAPLSATAGGAVVYPVPHPSGKPGTCAGCAPGSGPLIAGADGNVWFADPYDHAIGRITPAGVVTEFPFLGPSFQDVVMTRDKGGSMWLAITAPAGIPDVFRVSTSGSVTALPVPPVDIEQIAIAPDGNLWIAGGNQVAYLARLTPKGDYQQMGTPKTLGSAVGFAVSPTGLWFLESGPAGTFLLKVESSGQTTGFALAVPLDFRPSSFALGADDNFWILGEGSTGGAQVYRATRTGAATAFDLPDVGAPVGLVNGPDGKLWFVARTPNGLGRMTTDGVLRILPMPIGFNVDEMTAGPDGRMWFTGAGLDGIGSIGVTVPEATFAPQVLTFAAGTKHASDDIRNTGDAVLNIASVALDGPEAKSFSITGDECSRHAVAPGAQCSITLNQIAGSGPLGASIRVFDNATASPQRQWIAAGVQPCKLPVFLSPSEPDAPTNVGLLDVESGRLELNAQESFRYDDSTRLYRSQAEPVLAGGNAAWYDSMVRRWLPTFPGAVFPDGSRYAYTSGQPYSTVHVVDVATGRDQKLSLPKASWNIMSFGAEGIYLTSGYETRAPGLWLVNPNTGALSKVLSSQQVTAVGNGGAWVAARNPADPHPPIDAMGHTGYDEIIRIDLRTGTQTRWLYMPGSDISVGMITGKTVVVMAVRSDVGTMLLMTAPNLAKALQAPDKSDNFNLWAFDTAVSTGQGIWIPSRGGYLYLWTPESGLVVVAKTTASPAGPCQ